MNIQKINSTQNFGAIIGPNLSKEIARKKKYIYDSKSFVEERELNKINRAEARIKELLPNVDGSPIIVDIEPVYEKQLINNKWIAKKNIEYVIKDEYESIYYPTPRDKDGGLKSFKYQKLISTLEKLETVLNAIKE